MSTSLREAQKFLLTGGRAPATLHLARLLAQAGHQVIVAESMRRHLCRHSNSVHKNYQVPSPKAQPAAYIKALKEIIVAEDVDILIPTCEEVFYIAEAREDLSQYCTVLVDSAKTLSMLHHKHHFIQWLQTQQLTVPQTVSFTDINPLKTHLSGLPPGRRFILKPVYSRFGAHVHQVSTPIAHLPDLDLSLQKPWVLQEYITGKEYCTYAVAHQGQLVLYAAYAKSFTAGLGSCILFEPLNHLRLQQLVETIIQKLNFTGQIAFDVIESENGDLFPLECNPRLTSGIHLFSTEDSVERAFLNTVERPIIARNRQKAMLTLPMLLYAPMNLKHGFKAWFKHLFSSKDVIFSWRDMSPFFYQPFIMGDLWLESLQSRLSLLEVTTYDIEWNGL